MDISLHAHAVAAFERVVGAYVEDPVVDGAGKRFVVAEIMVEQRGIGCRHEVNGFLIADIVVSIYALRLGVEQVVA